jgi:hypothetical protein
MDFTKSSISGYSGKIMDVEKAAVLLDAQNINDSESN